MGECCQRRFGTRRAKRIRESLSVLDVVALERGKTLNGTPQMELYSAIIVEIAVAGFQSSRVQFMEGNQLGKVFISRKVKYSY